MAGDDELAAAGPPELLIFLKNLVEAEQKARMDRADLGVTERVRPCIEIAAPILEGC
jgi:hypothetical protein